MFLGCKSLIKINLTNFNIQKVKINSIYYVQGM